MEILTIVAYIMIIFCFALGLYAQIRVNIDFNTYSQVKPDSQNTTDDATQRLLDYCGLHDLRVLKTKGHLTDNYNTKNKSINLSESTRATYSVAGIGVIAHEIGHAMQDKEKYLPFRIRQFLVPVVKIGTFAFYPLFFIGIIILCVSPETQFGRILIIISCALYFLSTLFYLVTWPVERNASTRALKMLTGSGLLNDNELPMARKVLKSAELTYIATLLTSITYFLRFFLYLLPIIAGKRD